MSAAQPGELREALAEALLACLRDGNPLYYEDAAEECTDALLPVVTAYAERLARERAAEALEDVLGEECRNAHPAVRAAIADRIHALTADDQPVQP